MGLSICLSLGKNFNCHTVFVFWLVPRMADSMKWNVWYVLICNHPISHSQNCFEWSFFWRCLFQTPRIKPSENVRRSICRLLGNWFVASFDVLKMRIFLVDGWWFNILRYVCISCCLSKPNVGPLDPQVRAVLVQIVASQRSDNYSGLGSAGSYRGWRCWTVG